MRERAGSEYVRESRDEQSRERKPRGSRPPETHGVVGGQLINRDGQDAQDKSRTERFKISDFKFDI